MSLGCPQMKVFIYFTKLHVIIQEYLVRGLILDIVDSWMMAIYDCVVSGLGLLSYCSCGVAILMAAIEHALELVILIVSIFNPSCNSNQRR